MRDRTVNLCTGTGCNLTKLNRQAIRRAGSTERDRLTESGLSADLLAMATDPGQDGP